jgi:hypothetical protein
MPAQSLVSSLIGACCIVAAFSLFALGAQDGESTQRLVQIAPLCLVAVFGFRGSGLVKWAAIPVLGFWIVVVALSWSVARGGPLPQISGFDLDVGHGPAAMLAGAVCAIGLVMALTIRSGIRIGTGLAILAAIIGLQAGAYYASTYLPVDDHSLVVMD